jgi:hypothetical protein
VECLVEFELLRPLLELARVVVGNPSLPLTCFGFGISGTGELHMFVQVGDRFLDLARPKVFPSSQIECERLLGILSDDLRQQGNRLAVVTSGGGLGRLLQQVFLRLIGPCPLGEKDDEHPNQTSGPSNGPHKEVPIILEIAAR